MSGTRRTWVAGASPGAAGPDAPRTPASPSAWAAPGPQSGHPLQGVHLAPGVTLAPGWAPILPSRRISLLSPEGWGWGHRKWRPPRGGGPPGDGGVMEGDRHKEMAEWASRIALFPRGILYPHPNVCFMITDKPADCLFSLAFLALSVLCPPTRLHCPMTLLFVTVSTFGSWAPKGEGREWKGREWE